MAQMSLLDMTQFVWNSIPLTNVPSTVFGNPDPQVRQMLTIMTRAGEYILKRHEWQALVKTFSVTATTDPNFAALPDDFPRFMQRASLWRSDSNLIPAIGPVGPDDWTFLVNVPYSGFPGYWRLADNQLQTLGITVGVTATMQYISKNWVTHANATTGRFWTADTDTTIFDDEVFRLFALWQWKQSKGLAYDEDMTTFGMELEQAIASDRSARPASTQYWLAQNGGQFSWPGLVVTP